MAGLMRHCLRAEFLKQRSFAEVVMTMIRVDGKRTRYSAVYLAMYRFWAPVQVHSRMSDGAIRSFEERRGKTDADLGSSSHIDGAMSSKPGIVSLFPLLFAIILNDKVSPGSGNSETAANGSTDSRCRFGERSTVLLGLHPCLFVTRAYV
jgi:hypothetical protein